MPLSTLLINPPLTKRHFLYRRSEEIQLLRNISTVDERVEYVKERVKSAIEYYKNLKPIFKDDDYKFLKTWLEVIERLQKGMEEC